MVSTHLLPLINITITIILITSLTMAGRVTQVGNDLTASLSGVDVPGVSFLLDDLILTEGTLFAYSAFFRSDKPIRFQVWRQMSSGDKMRKRFKLIGETRVIPSVKYQREDVYVIAKLTERCVHVQTGDRLGVYFEETPGAVAYTFDPTFPMALGHTVDDLNRPTLVNETVTFDSLTFPYDFSMAAYVDTASAKPGDRDVRTGCPRTLLIPPYVAPTLAPTYAPIAVSGEPGATGSTGPQGATGYTGRVGPQGFPGLRGSPGATGYTGLSGLRGPGGGVGGTGATGRVGMIGSTGAPGPRGEKGDRGGAGPPGPPGQSLIQDADGNTVALLDDAETTQTNRVLVFVLLAWTIIVTIAVVAIIIVLILLRRREERSTLRPLKTSSNLRTNWMDTLKDESSTGYQNTTISTLESSRSSGIFRRDSAYQTSPAISSERLSSFQPSTSSMSVDKIDRSSYPSIAPSAYYGIANSDDEGSLRSAIRPFSYTSVAIATTAARHDEGSGCPI